MLSFCGGSGVAVAAVVGWATGAVGSVAAAVAGAAAVAAGEGWAVEVGESLPQATASIRVARVRRAAMGISSFRVMVGSLFSLI